ncbi:DUF397 domain-containing protein [Kitasatospora sp. NPDC008050]|uniref:DUF397 domain-containing protein n=1 Tax=Kitasatospora sp. NPDC008050 TaxID=3364021 RepID=UPI0036E4366C
MGNPLDHGADESITWHKSSYSGEPSGNCVEVGRHPTGTTGTVPVPVHDTKDREGGTLTFSPEGWTAFISGIQADDPQLTGGLA